jgi:hypothetical protein
VSGWVGSKQVNVMLLDLCAGISTFLHYYSLFDETERMTRVHMLFLRLPAIITTLNFLLVILEAYLVVGTEIIIPLSNPQKAKKNRKYQQKTENGHVYWHSNNCINYSWTEHFQSKYSCRACTLLKIQSIIF